MKDKKQPKTKSNKKITGIIFMTAVIVIFLAGIAMLIYPSLGNVISYFQQRQVIDEYEKQVAQMREEDITLQKQLAIAYNKSLGQITFADPFDIEETKPEDEDDGIQTLDEYYKALSVGGQNMMGYIKIPKISISIPIYHDATEAQLQKGIGHLKGTSMPIGGKGTHCVLSGHTGIPGNQLFTDLDKLEIGDKFYLHVLDEVLAYRVDEINVVEPDDVSKLQIDPDEDYCTLLTCTPYGINSHRLLVRGVRTEYMPGEDDDDAKVIEVTDENGNVIETKVQNKDYIDLFGLHIPYWVLYILVPLLAFIIILIIVIIVRRRLRRSEKKKDKKD